MNTIGIVRIFLKNIIPLLMWISESSAGIPEMSNSMIKIKSVKDKILNGYDKTICPTVEGMNTTLVSVQLIPKRILEVDEERGLFVLDSYISLAWADPRLKWDTSEYDEILQLPPDLFWIPNIFIHNSHTTKINPNGEAMLSILAEGFVSWITTIQTETFCSIITHPNKMVTCRIKIGTRPYDGWEIDVFHEKNLLLKTFSNMNPRWELLTSQTKVIASKNEKGHMNLSIAFPIKRRTPSEIGVIRQLCNLVMVLTLSVFWLPPDSSKKVVLGGMLILVLTQLLLHFSWSTRYPLSALFTESLIQPSMYILVTTLLLQLLVIFNLCKITGPARPPTAMIQLLKGVLGKFLCLRLPVDANKNIPSDEIQLQEITSKSMLSTTTRDDWMLLASSLDRLFFIIMAIAVIIINS